jgi:hypothetical protein
MIVFLTNIIVFLLHKLFVEGDKYYFSKTTEQQREKFPIAILFIGFIVLPFLIGILYYKVKIYFYERKQK